MVGAAETPPRLLAYRTNLNRGSFFIHTIMKQVQITDAAFDFLEGLRNENGASSIKANLCDVFCSIIFDEQGCPKSQPIGDLYQQAGAVNDMVVFINELTKMQD